MIMIVIDNNNSSFYDIIITWCKIGNREMQYGMHK